jgi:hypothetical protein
MRTSRPLTDQVEVAMLSTSDVVFGEVVVEMLGVRKDDTAELAGLDFPKTAIGGGDGTRSRCSF